MTTKTDTQATYEKWLGARADDPTLPHDLIRDAFLAGVEAALQSQPQETIAYVTRNEEGDPAMLFFDLKEARLYCNPDEEPEALVLAGSALQSSEVQELLDALQEVVDAADGGG